MSSTSHDGENGRLSSKSAAFSQQASALLKSIESLSRSVHEEFENVNKERPPHLPRSHQYSKSTNLNSSGHCTGSNKGITELTDAIRQDLREMLDEAIVTKKCIQEQDSKSEGRLFINDQKRIESICDSDECCNITEIFAREGNTRGSTR